MAAVKRITRYLNGTVDVGIWYSKDTNMNIASFCDTDWAGNVNRKSTNGDSFYLGNDLISWHNKKLNSISFFIVEAEYIVAGSCSTRLLWMKQMLEDFGIVLDCLTLYCDNTNISNNPLQHSRTKHIDIRHHFVRELVEKKIVAVEYVETERQFVDIFTKALDFVKFDYLRKAFGIHVM